MCYSVNIASMQPFQDVCFLDGTYGRFKLGILQRIWLAYIWNIRTEQNNCEAEDGLCARRPRVHEGVRLVPRLLLRLFLARPAESHVSKESASRLYGVWPHGLRHLSYVSASEEARRCQR